jgi:hypothetical protein
MVLRFHYWQLFVLGSDSGLISLYTEDGDYVSTFSLTWSWPTAFLSAGLSEQEAEDQSWSNVETADPSSSSSFFLTSVEPSNGKRDQSTPVSAATPRRLMTSPGLSTQSTAAAQSALTALTAAALNVPPPPLTSPFPSLPRPQTLYMEVTPPYRPHTLQKFALETDNFSFESVHAGYLQVEKERQAIEKREQLVSVCFLHCHDFVPVIHAFKVVHLLNRLCWNCFLQRDRQRRLGLASRLDQRTAEFENLIRLPQSLSAQQQQQQAGFLARKRVSMSYSGAQAAQYQVSLSQYMSQPSAGTSPQTSRPGTSSGHSQTGQSSPAGFSTSANGGIKRGGTPNAQLLNIPTHTRSSSRGSNSGEPSLPSSRGVGK